MGPDDYNIRIWHCNGPWERAQFNYTFCSNLATLILVDVIPEKETVKHHACDKCEPNIAVLIDVMES